MSARSLVVMIASAVVGLLAGAWLTAIGIVPASYFGVDRGGASPKLSVAEAKKFVEARIQDKAQNCVRLPTIGERMKVYIKIDAIMNQEQKFVYENTRALEPFERAEVVKIETVEQTPNYYFKIANVRLSDGLGEEVRGLGPTGHPCLIMGSGQVKEIVKIDPVKGGKTAWDGAIIYATYSYDETPLYLKFAAAQGRSPMSRDRKLRVIAKYDPILGLWKGAGSDWAPIQSDSYFSQNVPNQINSD